MSTGGNNEYSRTGPLPVHCLYKKVLFPHSSLLLELRIKGESIFQTGQKLLVVPVGGPFDLIIMRNRFATISEVADVTVDGEVSKVLLRGIDRVRLLARKGLREAYFRRLEADVRERPEKAVDELRKKSQELIFLINVDESDRLIHLLNFLADLSQLADFISNYFVVDFRKRLRLYREPDVNARAAMLVELLDELIAKMKRKNAVEQ
jgi:ATP-dependent Lon protease